MDINDKIARCRLIASLIVADDNVEDAEIELLERAMARLAMTEEEKARVMVLLNEDEAEAMLKSLNNEERLQFLDDLAEVAWVDEHLDDYEVEHLQRVASAMSLDEDAVQRAIDKHRPQS